MIVVDTDVIASFWIKSTRTHAALRVRRRDADWIAPVLWRSEFRSVLRQYILAGHIGYADAVWIAEKAETTMRGKEYTVGTDAVLKLVEQSHHSSYDCEYVALAEAEGLRLVTGDRTVARLFPRVAILLEVFVQ